MPKIALSKVVKETSFLKEIDCFVGSKKKLSDAETSVIEKNIDLLRGCFSKVPGASKVLKSDTDSIVFVDKHQFLRRGHGSEEGAYSSGGKKVAIVDFTQENPLNFLYSFFAALEELTHHSDKDIYDRSENRDSFVYLLEFQKFSSKLKVDKIMKAFFLDGTRDSESEVSFDKYWKEFKKSEEYHKYDGMYSFMEMLSSPTEEEHKGAGSSSSESDVELVGDDLPELG